MKHEERVRKAQELNDRLAFQRRSPEWQARNRRWEQSHRAVQLLERSPLESPEAADPSQKLILVFHKRGDTKDS